MLLKSSIFIALVTLCCAWDFSPLLASREKPTCLNLRRNTQAVADGAQNPTRGDILHGLATTLAVAGLGAPLGSAAWAAAVTSSVSTDPDPVVFDLLPQFHTVDDVPQEYFEEQRFIYAFVERVIDGDTIRVRHIPGFGLGRKAPQPLAKRGISNETLSVRVYGVDCPETGKNKRKVSQPYGDEAEAFTKDLVFHRMVRVTFLRRDQYRRAVAQVETVEDSVFSPPKDLTLELAKEGLAEMYRGGGAVYNGKKKEIENAIDQAKNRKKGIWSLDDRVSAAEYKKNMREGAPIASSALPANLASAKGSATTPKSNVFSRNTHNLIDLAVTGLELM